jgi:hypothetical protein
VKRHLLALCAIVSLAARAEEREPLGRPWRPVAPGVDAASAAELGGAQGWAARVVLIDPRKARFIVRFDPSKPRLDQWRARYPQALVVANGSFFSEDGRVRPTCDLIADGKLLRGAGCQRQDALYFGAVRRPPQPAKESAEPALTNTVVRRSVPAAARTVAKDDTAAAAEGPRLLAAADFKPAQWSEALKSFPAMVRGGYPACVGNNYCAEVSRTAALAQLRDGRVLLFASQWPAVRKDVARFLAETLGAEEAVNLDGGPEATLALRGESADEAVADAKVGLPAVILVLPAD